MSNSSHVKYLIFVAGVGLLVVIVALNSRYESPGPIRPGDVSTKPVSYSPPGVNPGAAVIAVPSVRLGENPVLASKLTFPSSVDSRRPFVFRGKVEWDEEPPAQWAVVAEWVGKGADGREVIGGSAIGRSRKLSDLTWEYEIETKAPRDLMAYQIRVRVNDHRDPAIRSTDIAKTVSSVLVVPAKR